ncbi:MAG TPA: hypothetical protein VHP32_08425 [Ignavibacteria bacterium]|nr:hypothetical protein [Ignavibacteria bacterium]
MTYKIFLAVFYLIWSANLFAKNSIHNEVSELVFLDHLLKNNPDVIDFIDEDELKRSNRFGITYYNEPIKFLINYNIPDEVKDDIIKKGKKFQADVKPLDDDYTILKFFYPEKNYSANFYFKDGKCIAPVTYFSRNYHRDSSKYFDFYIKEPIYFNEYCKEQLDKFIELKWFSSTASERKELETKKMIYVFCNESDMINIIGQSAKGVFLVANDIVVSTYNAHYHELMHFVMNYKLKTNIKPCHPFFLEGFATGMAGRGGLLMPALMPAAKYSITSGLVNIKSLLSMKNFLAEDASITYPVAGAYSLFLFVKVGFEAYRTHYLQFSGDYDYLNNIDSTNTELPYLNEFYDYISHPALDFVNITNLMPPNEEPVIDDPDFKLYRNDSDYVFLLTNKVLFKNPKYIFNYRSDLFEEKFPGIEYLNYNILIEANSDEINFYYLHTNYLVLTYKKAFSIDAKSVPKYNNYYIFSISRAFFSETEFHNLKYVTIE